MYGNILKDIRKEGTEICKDIIQAYSAEPKSVEVINRIVKVCPYGTASAYTHELGTKNNPNINLEKEIAKLAISVFATIFCKQLGVDTVVADIYSDIYNYLKDNDPNTKGLSYKVTNYAHKNYTNTYITPIKTYAFKSVYKWYSRTNYQGNIKNSTVYQTKEFS